ncbi:hypothetical protein ACH4GK_37675 [Streptomyces rimosus]|uniref:hypothetical protein n=1 Tax=Streptomyces rimosus TaxID=1927 RepID=UPI00067D75D7|nr:hypothetical protein [Streptomyces rimosus]
MRALLGVPGLAGVSDAVRLAVLVLASRTPSDTGVVEIRTSELGRWLGLSASYVASAVLPVLRRSGVVSVGTAEGEFGQDDGLACRVLPLWAAQDVVGHPLALSRKELAVLLRLLEAVMAPGWRHRDGRVTPAGLLGSRTGRGAATDRLALLLLVLEARENGRVRQCGGAVDTKRGRAAATLARLLGCEASAGERVLERLEARGLVRRVRVQTASDLAHRTRLLVPAVAAAHGRAVAGGDREDRTGALKPEFSDPDGAAGSGETLEAEAGPQVSGVLVMDEADVAEPDAVATLHTDHPGVVTEVGNGADVGGFSGEGRGGSGDLPGRAGAREDRSADDQDDVRLRAAGGTGGPLRGDKPNRLLTHLPQQYEHPPAVAGQASAEDSSEQDGACVPRAWSGPGCGSSSRGRVPRPRGDLEAVLAPVRVLWDRLGTSGARRVVEQAARRELRYATNVVGPERAAGVLAERLTRRLAAQPGGPDAVTDPVGWLRGRGLPRSSPCTDARCDEGTLMHSGAACERCADLLAERRGRRRQASAQVRAELPDADSQTRRQAVEHRLRAVVAADLARDEQRRRQAAEAEAVRAAAAQRARAEAELVEQVRRARPCRGCGAPDAGGWCGVCRAQEETEMLILQAVAATVAGSGLEDGPGQDMVLRSEAALRARVQDACAQPRAAGGTDVTAAVAGRLAAESLLRKRRISALWALARGPEAEAEAGQARAAQLRRRHLHSSSKAAEQAAATAAQEARQRVAEHLLGARSRAWLAAQGPQPAEAPPGEPGQQAAFVAHVARARAAITVRMPAAFTGRERQGERRWRRSRELLRSGADPAQDAAAAQETARLRAQIAAQLPELAAVTAAHHGARYVAAEAVGGE